VLTSVHAFAVDPARGVFILAILVIAVGGALSLYAWRAPALAPGGLFQPISREGALVLNNLLLATACATVFLGTLYPLFLDAISGARVSVGPPFFNSTFVPLMVPLLLAVSVGPLLGWKRGDLLAALTRLWVAGALSLLAIALAFALVRRGPWLAPFAIGLAAWLVLGALAEWAERVRLFRVPLADTFARARGLPRAAWGMTIAHAGLGFVVAGITAVSAWQVERVTTLRPGQSIELAGYTLTLASTQRVNGPNYVGRRANFNVARDGAVVATLAPERRFFIVQRQSTTEAAIRTDWISDIYVVIGDPEGAANAPADARAPAFLTAPDDGAWTVRAYYNPLAPWIWLGAVITALGGLISLSDRRYRVGAPSRRRVAAAPAE